VREAHIEIPYFQTGGGQRGGTDRPITELSREGKLRVALQHRREIVEIACHYAACIISSTRRKPHGGSCWS